MNPIVATSNPRALPVPTNILYKSEHFDKLLSPHPFFACRQGASNMQVAQVLSFAMNTSNVGMSLPTEESDRQLNFPIPVEHDISVHSHKRQNEVHKATKKSTRAARKTYKRDPNAPRRFKSAFILFSAKKHREIRKQLGAEGQKTKVRLKNTTSQQTTHAYVKCHSLFFFFLKKVNISC